MKKILIIATSPRRDGNSDILAHSFERGAREAGHDVQFVELRDKTIAFCKGCFSCLNTHRCVIRDDADEIRAMMLESDVIVWATPVYYYSVSGQMKVMIDRANPLYDDDYKFRDVYLLATAAEDEATTFDGTFCTLQGWVDCFEKARVAGTVFAGGVNQKREIIGHPALEKAYQLAKEIK